MAHYRYLTFNLTTGKFVNSFGNPSIISTPIAIYGDVPTYQFRFVEAGETGIGSVAVKSTSGVGLQVVIAKTDGTVLTSATAGTPSNDTYPTTIQFNTADVLAALPSLPSVLDAVIQFNFSDGGNLTTYTADWRIKKRAGSTVVADPPSPLVAATTADLRSFAVPKDGTGIENDVKIWVSPDGTKKRVQYLGNDGQMRYDPL